MVNPFLTSITAGLKETFKYLPTCNLKCLAFSSVRASEGRVRLAVGKMWNMPMNEAWNRFLLCLLKCVHPQQASETGETSCPSYSHLCTVLMYRARMFIPNFFAPLLFQYIRLQRKKIIQGEMAFCPSHNTENDPLVRPTAKPFRSPGFFGGTETFKQRTSSWRPPLFILVQLISSFPPSPAVAVMLYVKLTGG